MTAIPLSPHNSALLANAAYFLQMASGPEQFRGLADDYLPDGFEPIGDLLKGRTGVNRITNFAAVLKRTNSGKGEMVVTIRGTEFGLNGDVLTDINLGLIPGPTGFPCHGGFAFTYRSIIKAIQDVVGPAPKTVHVVGHSLGGAVANLVALDLQQQGHTSYLYTYGAPRVGPLGFAVSAGKLLSGRIFRVFDRGDPIPMVPFLPFVHAPLHGEIYRVGDNRGMISLDYHDMADNYCKWTKGIKDWRQLADKYQGFELQFGPRYWLDKAGEYCIRPGDSFGLHLLGIALEHIIKAIASTVQNLALTGPCTVVDLLAYALIRGIEIGGQIKEWVQEWVQRAMEWLGRKVVAPAREVTRIFLQFVLGLLIQHIAVHVRKALDMVRRRGHL